MKNENEQMVNEMIEALKSSIKHEKVKFKVSKCEMDFKSCRSLAPNGLQIGDVAVFGNETVNNR